ncbi:acid phosphatase [Vibrio fortis]|uniref:Acid phosphatase n=1 Tax=Vibrio fortis TaxID=212667 RepID=A0A5N3S8B6_9VIBR|nr:Ig domain-containing protein [Vibrio fortis]KAB0302093.1 acid phosphatase [Vibrio fortis]
MKKVSLLAASVAIALSGCGGSDGGSSDGATPGGIVITAIDGYLENAQVWVDTNDNLKLDSEDKQLDSNTNANGEITLPNEYKDKAVFIKAIAGQTIDKTRGLVTSDFDLAATAGATVISPMTNMVVEQMEANSSLTLEQAQENVVDSVTASGLEASNELIFGDYIADDSQEAEALNVIGETLVDNSNISVEQQLQLTSAVAEETKKVIDDPTESLEDFSPVVEVPEDGGAPIVTPNSRPVHDQANGQLDPIVMVKGDAWAPINASQNFSDAEDDVLTYELKELTGKLNGLVIDNVSGIISGTPEAVGEFNYQIFAKDEHQSLSYPLNLKVTIEAENTAPVLNKDEEARLQKEEVETWYLQEGEAFSQTLNISHLFKDEDGSIEGIRVGLGGVVDGLSVDTDRENMLVTLHGTPTTSWNQHGKLTISVRDNDNAYSEDALFLMPHVLEGAPVEPPVPELGFTEAHFNNQEWKMGSFADNDGEIGYASLAKDEHGLMFCWGSNSDENYSGNMSDALDQWGNSYAPFAKLAELDKHNDYMSHQDKDCMDVTINDGKMIDKEGSIYEMLYQHKPAEGEYQIILKVNQDELFWLDSTSSTFAQTSPASEKIISGFTDFDLTVEAGEEFDPELDGYPLTYAAGQFVYAESSYDYKSIKPTGFETPGNLSYEFDSFGREGIVLEETGADSDYKTRYRYIQREFGDFYIGVKWSEEPQWNYVSAPEFGLYSYDQESMEKVIDKLPLIQD